MRRGSGLCIVAMLALPLHLGIRQYRRDFDALERWVRSEPHRTWWQELLRGGVEAIFLDLDRPTALLGARLCSVYPTLSRWPPPVTSAPGAGPSASGRRRSNRPYRSR